MASHVLLLLLLISFQLIITASLSQQLPADADADKDRWTLLKMLEQMGNPRGIPPLRPGTDHCEWFFGAVECDEHRRVIYLVFRGPMFNNFTSPLPTAIGELDQLQSIAIVDVPCFTGPIPDTFGDLKHLNNLLIAGTSVSGAIPASLSGATSLAYIYLSDNKLTGSIPKSLANLPRLTAFFAANNLLTGPIPPLLVRSGSLVLSNNRLTGMIPWTYGVRNIYQFMVANNELTGDASFLFNRRKATAYLDLSGNRLRFNLTGVEIPGDMQVLNLARNRIYGRVPAALAQATKLVGLDLSYNELCGKIPTGGKLAQFTAAAYEHNACLCGTPLPPC